MGGGRGEEGERSSTIGGIQQSCFLGGLLAVSIAVFRAPDRSDIRQCTPIGLCVPFIPREPPSGDVELCEVPRAQRMGVNVLHLSRQSCKR